MVAPEVPEVSLRTTALRSVMPLRRPPKTTSPRQRPLRPSPSTSSDPSTPLRVGCGVGRETGFTLRVSGRAGLPDHTASECAKANREARFRGRTVWWGNVT